MSIDKREEMELEALKETTGKFFYLLGDIKIILELMEKRLDNIKADAEANIKQFNDDDSFSDTIFMYRDRELYGEHKGIMSTYHIICQLLERYAPHDEKKED